MMDFRPAHLPVKPLLLLTALSLGLIACDREPIRTYRAPHEDNAPPSPAAPPTTPPTPPALDAHAHAPNSDIAYEFTQPLPPGWQIDPQTRSMVLGAYRITQDTQSALLTVTSFPGDVGGNLANINRWRRQLGLEPLTNEAEAKLVAITVAGQPGWLFDAVGEQSRLLVAFALIDGRTWFFKMQGPAALLETQKSALRNLVQTVQLRPPPAPAPEMPRG